MPILVLSRIYSLLNYLKNIYSFFLVVSEVSKAGDFYLWPSFLKTGYVIL